MLLVPFLVGVLRVGAGWLHLVLLVAWLAGYLMSYFALLAVKTGRWRRHRPQLLGYGGLTLGATVPVLLTVPRVLLLAPAYSVLLGVNLWHARRRQDRALVNGMASVLQSTLMVFLVAIVAGVPPLTVWDAFVTVLLYLAGTLLYVKTVIRERGSRSYLVASVAYHAGALCVAALVAPVLALLFGWFLVRAVVVPWRTPSVAVVGLLEVAGSVALVLAAW
jgi:hypothetical protein